MDLGPEGVAACIDQAGLGFMYAPRYHPAMGKLRPVRTALKVVGWGGGGGGGGS
jgi:anthranilate phosphoribosyltransferase